MNYLFKYFFSALKRCDKLGLWTSRVCFSVSLFFLGQYSFSQNETAKWYFGYFAGLDFMTSPPSILTNGQTNSGGGNPSISNSAGTLLFYSDGTNIRNSAHAIMANGSGLNTGGWRDVIVKRPGSQNIYEIFMLSTGFGALYYSEIDMSLAAGMGSVTVRNVVLGSFLSTQLSAVKACNGVDVWVAVHGTTSSGPNNFYSFLVTSTGVNGFPVISTTGPTVVFSPMNATTMKFSPNGTKLGFGTYGLVTVFDFDASTGIFSNPFSLQTTPPSFQWPSIEFSPDGSKIYSKSFNDLKQWDLCAGNSTLVLSSVTTFTSPNNLNLTSLQLAKDGKIYVGQGSQTFLGVINNPNVAGSGCNYVPNALSLLPGICGTLPSFVTSYFKTPPPPFSFSAGGIYGCQTVSFTAPPPTSTCTSPGYSVTGMQWNFSDPLSGSANTSTLSNPTHVFTSVGIHTVQLVLYYSCGGGTDTLRQAVNVVQPCLTVNNTSITCATLGSATVQTNSGTGPFSFTWMPTVQTGSVATGLNPGTYTISVFDAPNNMTYTASTVFTSPVPLAGTLNSGSIACNGASTGTANYTNITGGSVSQNYLWTNGILSYTLPGPANLSAGSWSSVVTDALTGCSISNTFLITQPTALTATLSGSNQGACAGATVALTTTVNGGTPPYNYLWAGGPASANYTPGPAPGSITVYSVTALDLNNCAVAGSIVINSSPAPVIVLNSSVLCQASNLSFSVSSASGGTGFSWTGPQAFSSLLQANNLSSVLPNQGGVYQLTVTAANGCTASANATVLINPTPTLSAVGSTICTSQTLNVSANSVPGASFSWSGPSGFTSALQNASVANPLLGQSGTYTLIATSIDGCSNTALANVSVISPPNLTIALSSSSMCAQALNGSPNTIILNSSGATTYTLSTPNHISNSNPGGPASPLSLLPPYSLSGPATSTLVGSNGICTSSLAATFTIIPNPTVSIISATPVICAGQTFTYTSTGANSYVWSASNPGSFVYTTGSVAVANPSVNSVFSVFGGSLGCNSVLQSHNITVNPLPVFNIAGNPVICLGTPAVLSAIGTGTLYNWSPNVGLNAYSGATVSANPMANQNYMVTASLNNCTTTAMIAVVVLPLPSASIIVSKPVICLNDTVTLQGFGGKTYNWQGPANFNSGSQNVIFSVNNISYAGNYILTVTDANGCKNKANTNILVQQLPGGSLTGQQQGCIPFCTELQLTTNPAVSIDWSFNQRNIKGKKFYQCFGNAGTYRVWSNFYDSTTTCSNSLEYDILVYPKPKTDFNFNPEQPVENFDKVQFSDASDGAVQYSWIFGKSTFSSNRKNPEFLFENTGYYPVVLVVQNKWQCSDTVIKVVYVAPDFAVYVPNAFTPNEDGLNELFVPVLRGSKAFTFTIFDRWGKKIFETSDITKGWDGSFKGEVCQEDVYIWKLIVSGENDVNSDKGKQVRNLTGEVLLYR